MGISPPSAQKKSNIDYSTAVQWAAWIRDLLVQWVWEEVITQELKFDGIMEIDESLFGRKIKYHRGDPPRTATDLGSRVGGMRFRTGNLLPSGR